MDVYERLQEEDLMQASVIMASFLYNAANRDQMMPAQANRRAGIRTVEDQLIWQRRQNGTPTGGGKLSS